MRKKLLGITLLFAAAFIFGCSYVASSIGMKSIDAFTFNCIRFPLGTLVLLPIVVANKFHFPHRKKNIPAKRDCISIKTWISGACMGMVLCVAAFFQQTAFNYSSSGKIAFITSLYVLIVPVLGLFFGKKVPRFIWGCIAIAIIGLWFLCNPLRSAFGINFGDLLALACAIFYAIHILFIEDYAVKYSPVELSFVQFLTAGFISFVLMLVFESPSISSNRTVILALLYSGVLCCGVAFTFQIIGQKYTPSFIAALIMSLESVFGLLSALIILHEKPTWLEASGCFFMLLAVISSQLFEIRNQKNIATKNNSINYSAELDKMKK